MNIEIMFCWFVFVEVGIIFLDRMFMVEYVVKLLDVIEVMCNSCIGEVFGNENVCL